MTAVEQTKDKEARSFQSFNGTTWHQRGSEARQTDRGDVFSLSHSPGHLVLLTFCSGNTKRDGAPKSILSRLWRSTGWRPVQAVLGKWHDEWQKARFFFFFFFSACLSVCGLETARVLSFPLSAAAER